MTHVSVKCRLNESVFNSKTKWNHDECCCECKEIDVWSSCKDDYLQNPSMCDCECNKTGILTWKTDKYLDIKNCSCRKCLFGQFVLTWEDEILNTTETKVKDLTCPTSLVDKKLTDTR